MAQDDLLKRVQDLEQKVGKLNYPIDFNTQGGIEQTQFHTLKALQFKGGLPIFTTIRTDIPTQGEMWLENVTGSPKKIAVYIDKVRYTFTQD